ncbi:MAG: NnrS family protein [Burkholderiaceae bacterium]|nr:NnrS family protein [Burkholderiaceae bacterium]
MKSIPIGVARPVPSAEHSTVSQPGWHPRWLLAAPHRLGFCAAACMLSLSALWWSAVLLSRAVGYSPAWAVPPPAAHALLMGLGFTPLFIAGFLFTAGPKWLGQPAVDARVLLRPVLLMLAGWCLVVPGLHLSSTLAAAGLALVAGGWSRLCWRFVAILRASRAPDRTHAQVVAAACVVGATTMWVAACALAGADVTLLRAATQVALWCFVATVFVAVSHRMIPFFSASALPALDAWRPMWLLWVMVAALWIEALAAVAALGWGPLAPWLRGVQALMELPVALLLLWLALRWGMVQSLKIRMLAMLHAGFLWLGLAYALSAVSHSLMAWTDGEQSLGLAPMHALTMGYLGATLLAMATRVSSGHSGRSLAADNTAWAMYWVLQAAVVMRVVAALWPSGATVLTLLAVLAWTTATVAWALRYGGWFVRPRIDARPG